MIDADDPTVSTLLKHGFRIAAHAYLHPSGRLRATVVAKDPETGRVLQGWSGNGDATDALRDLERRAGLPVSNAQ